MICSIDLLSSFRLKFPEIEIDEDAVNGYLSSINTEPNEDDLYDYVLYNDLIKDVHKF